MAKKGKVKNGRNKAKHTRLLSQKKNRLQNEKAKNKERLKALNEKIKQLKEQ